jgi:SAM-dependent methyltransferase
MGRWSRLVAREFAAWLAVAPSARWLDVGCGTGALTETILSEANPAHVDAIDQSEGFIRTARERVQNPRVRFEVGDASRLAAPTDPYHAVVSGLVLNFIPDLPAVMAGMVRVTRPGGVVAGYVWDYSDKMELIRYFFDAAIALDLTAVQHDEGRRFPVCRPEPLRDLFEDAELGDVAVRNIDIPTHFRDFEDYWTPFLAGRFPAPAYAMSLSEKDRRALRDRLRATLPIAGDGSIALIARAWAVRGQRA